MGCCCCSQRLAQYIRDVDLEDMWLFLDQSKEPYMMTCVELCSCLRFLNQLMHFFPGANNTAPYNEGCIKLMYLNMMPVKFWTQGAVNGRCCLLFGSACGLHDCSGRSKQSFSQNQALQSGKSQQN